MLPSEPCMTSYLKLPQYLTHLQNPFLALVKQISYRVHYWYNQYTYFFLNPSSATDVSFTIIGSSNPRYCQTVHYFRNGPRNMCKLLEIKYYSLLVMYTFSLVGYELSNCSYRRVLNFYKWFQWFLRNYSVILWLWIEFMGDRVTPIHWDLGRSIVLNSI